MQLPATAAGPAPAAIAPASLSPACGGCEPGGRRNVPSVQDTPACPGAAAARANARGRVRVRLLPRHGRVRADSGARRPGTESSGSAARLGPAPPARRAATPDTVRLPKAAQADSCRIEVKGRSRPGGQPKQRLPCPRRSRGRGSSWPALQPARPSARDLQGKLAPPQGSAPNTPRPVHRTQPGRPSSPPGWRLLVVIVEGFSQASAHFGGGFEQRLRLRLADLPDVLACVSNETLQHLPQVGGVVRLALMAHSTAAMAG
jgi:hypothetical protein